MKKNEVFIETHKNVCLLFLVALAIECNLHVAKALVQLSKEQLLKGIDPEF